MGTLRSIINHEGILVNGILLGSPKQDADEDGNVVENSDYCWDDSRLPNGIIDIDGNIIIDEEEQV